MSAQHTSRPAASYDAVRRHAGWIDKRLRGRLRFEGDDRASFLHALVSNDVAALQPGQGVYATYLTPQGRLIAELRIYCASDYLLADVPAGVAENLVERFDQIIFTERVSIQNVSQSLAQIGVIGAEAASVVASLYGVEPHRVQQLPTLSHVAVDGTLIARTDDTSLPGFDLFIASTSSHALLEKLARIDVSEASESVVEALRIEAGRPLFGVDMTDETIPLEAGLLDRAISTSKGCYVGQEVIIRVLHRGAGRVAKKLVQFTLEVGRKEIPRAGATISTDDKPTGRITSAAWSDGQQRVVALGYVHRDVAEVGRRVSIDGRDAEIVGLAG